MALSTASATWATQHDARVLERLFPPVLGNAARDVRVVERGPFLVTAFSLAIPWSAAIVSECDAHHPPHGAAGVESMEMLGIRLPQATPRPPYRDTIAKTLCPVLG